MAAVALSILQPADGAIKVAPATVPLVGAVGSLPAELAGVNLHYRWYSGLFEARQDRYSINQTAIPDPSVAFDAALGVGSHAIALAASDRPGETRADQDATSHGGVAGGAEGPKRCVVHVLTASLVAPASPGATLSKAASTLAAQAPLHWTNPGYQALNRIRYRWRFEPTPPDGRATDDLLPAPGELTFEPPGPVPLVRYTGPLPAALGLGDYLLRLRVEHADHPDHFHEQARAVVIAP